MNKWHNRQRFTSAGGFLLSAIGVIALVLLCAVPGLFSSVSPVIDEAGSGIAIPSLGILVPAVLQLLLFFLP
jgi:hypothetical protein